MAILSDQELAAALDGLPQWQRAGNSIVRSYKFPNFAAALRFVNQVAEVAEAANHHPDIVINYNKVVLQLTSHDSGGVTKRDIRMAARIDTIDPEAQK